MKKIVLAYSGGLDTSYCLKKLSNEGHQVHAVSINTPTQNKASYDAAVAAQGPDNQDTKLYWDTK